MLLPRRGFIIGLASLLASPAVVRPESLMKLIGPRPTIVVPRIRLPDNFTVTLGSKLSVQEVQSNTLLALNQITREAVRLFKNSNSFLLAMENEIPLLPPESTPWAK